MIEKSIIIEYSQHIPLSIFIDFRYALLIFIDFYQMLSIINFIDWKRRELFQSAEVSKMFNFRTLDGLLKLVNILKAHWSSTCGWEIIDFNIMNSIVLPWTHRWMC